MATLHYVQSSHNAQTQTRIPTPYFCAGQEPESVSGNVNEPWRWTDCLCVQGSVTLTLRVNRPFCSHLTFAFVSTSTSHQWWHKRKHRDWIWTHSLRQCLHCYWHNAQLWYWCKSDVKSEQSLYGVFPLPDSYADIMQKGSTGTDSNGHSDTKLLWKLLKKPPYWYQYWCQIGYSTHLHQNRNQNRFSGNNSAHY